MQIQGDARRIPNIWETFKDSVSINETRRKQKMMKFLWGKGSQQYGEILGFFFCAMFTLVKAQFNSFVVKKLIESAGI